eukprot:CAMPEP_0176415374 /NCGR_PEP_ID=MMETSP0127-20121128/5774_1 /TAXON_ID=938130 /ORGANISM="Platyophrya macrostoma, Strain WH" /LENGTH=168 /DNA_ID=CAMNT_0017795369 /DNA_START=529 /DNA_END=1035 /DNA_ORIENTATION=-
MGLKNDDAPMSPSTAISTLLSSPVPETDFMMRSRVSRGKSAVGSYAGMAEADWKPGPILIEDDPRPTRARAVDAVAVPPPVAALEPPADSDFTEALDGNGNADVAAVIFDSVASCSFAICACTCFNRSRCTRLMSSGSSSPTSSFTRVSAFGLNFKFGSFGGIAAKTL